MNTTADPSVALASATLRAGVTSGPATVADTACDSFRPSGVQMAPVALQSVVSGSRITTSASESGLTSMFQCWSLPSVFRRAAFTLPPVTSNAESRNVLKLSPATFSLNDSVNVNALEPSWLAGTFENEAVRGARSLSLIVPVAVESPSVAFVGLDSVSVKVSFSSSTESSVVATLTVFDVSFAANVSVPDAAVKSVPLVAVPPEVAYATVTWSLLAGDRDTVNVTADPSVALAFATLSTGSGVSSLSSIVPVAVESPSVAFVGLDSVSVKVSSSSSSESSVVATLTVFDVSFAANVSVPDAAVKSVPLVAVPPEVAYATVTWSLLAGDSETVNTTADPSVALASATLSAGSGVSSLSSIVPVAVESPSVAFVGLDSVSVKVSSSSSTVSSVVATLTVFDVSFAANVSVPDAAVKSVPLVAVPPEVAYATVTVSLLAGDSETVNTTADPSVALASATLTAGVAAGPATVTETAWDSALPSAVHTASSAAQSVVADSDTVTAVVPEGRTGNS